MSRLGLAAPATKRQLKARVSFDGPSGSGKTWTSLEWAKVLAEGGTVLVVDTEHGSASLYADQFTFDVVRWEPPYNPTELADTIKDAGRSGYAVIVLDSLSHFWEGEGGTLDIVDAAAARSKGNTFAAWKVGTPALRHLIDTILGSPLHVVATMRTKQEWVLEDRNGKQVPRRVGMAPVMRAGVEYEFTLIGDLDLDHRMSVTKSRCSELADVVVEPGRAAEAAEKFRCWLGSGDEAVDDRRVPAPEAKRDLLRALGGDKEQASAVWDEWFPDAGDFVSSALVEEMVATVAGAPFDGGESDG